jgi:hypothetical protein
VRRGQRVGRALGLFLSFPSLQRRYLAHRIGGRSGRSGVLRDLRLLYSRRGPAIDLALPVSVAPATPHLPALLGLDHCGHGGALHQRRAHRLLGETTLVRLQLAGLAAGHFPRQDLFRPRPAALHHFHEPEFGVLVARDRGPVLPRDVRRAGLAQALQPDSHRHHRRRLRRHGNSGAANLRPVPRVLAVVRGRDGAEAGSGPAHSALVEAGTRHHPGVVLWRPRGRHRRAESADLPARFCDLLRAGVVDGRAARPLLQTPCLAGLVLLQHLSAAHPRQSGSDRGAVAPDDAGYHPLQSPGYGADADPDLRLLSPG